MLADYLPDTVSIQAKPNEGLFWSADRAARRGRFNYAIDERAIECVGPSRR